TNPHDAAPGGNADASADDLPLPSRAGGCVVVGPPRNAALQVVLLAGLIFGLRRGRRRWPIVALYLAAVLATSVSGTRPAAAAGGLTVDASATATGMSGVTFSHTMGTGGNGLLLVVVVVPITCNSTTGTDGGNCGGCGTTCASSTAAGLASGLLGLWRLN